MRARCASRGGDPARLRIALRAAAMGVAVALSTPGCGYGPPRAATDPLGPFAVAGGRARTPHAAAMAAAEAGARDELSRAGQLSTCGWAAGGKGPPCTVVVVDILRVDVSSAGVALEPSPTSLGPGVVTSEPRARGLSVTVLGRATLHRGPAEPPLRDTGDVLAEEVVATPPGAPVSDPALSTLARDEATRRAARRLGERMVRRLLGRPEP